MCQRSKRNAAALITFQLILTYVPQIDCVAFAASLDQMFHFAGITSNFVPSQRFSDVMNVNGTRLKERMAKRSLDETTGRLNRAGIAIFEQVISSGLMSQMLDS